MTGEQLVVLLLLGLAFAAGWYARGAGRARDAARAPDAAPEHTLRARAREALDVATERWLDDDGSPTPEGKEAVAAAERALAAVPDAGDGAVRAALGALAGFHEGRRLDAEALRALERADVALR